MILLDSDVLIEILDKKSLRGDRALRAILDSKENICTTSLNIHEVLYGLRKYAKPIEDILQLPALKFTKEDARLSSEIELEMERKGTSIRRMDAMIGAIAISNASILFTLDRRHFEPLTTFGLKLFAYDPRTSPVA